MVPRRRLFGSTRRPPPAGANAPAPLAPEGLRRRVLANVRGDQPNGQERAGSTSRGARTIAAGLVIVGTFALGALLGVSLGESAHEPPSIADSNGNPPHVRASIHRIDASAELVVSGMREPLTGEVYEVWLIRPGVPPQPTDALFTVTSAGEGAVGVPGNLRGVREVMVSSEPLGGSLSPTSPAVLRVPLLPTRG